MTSSVSDVPWTSVSARHFELPIVEEGDEKNNEDKNTARSKETQDAGTQPQTDQPDDDVFSPLTTKASKEVTFQHGLGVDHKLVNASTQTNASQDDDTEWLKVRKDVLYQCIPLPASTTTTPTTSHINLENF